MSLVSWVVFDRTGFPIAFADSAVVPRWELEQEYPGAEIRECAGAVRSELLALHAKGRRSTPPPPPPPPPPTLFDAEMGTQLRDAALVAVATNASPDWMEAAYDAAVWCAQNLAEFTTDQVWERLAVMQVPEPHEPRAMGAVMRRAAADGVVHPTAQHRPSERPATHRNPKRVYRSVALARPVPDVVDLCKRIRRLAAADDLEGIRRLVDDVIAMT